MTNMATTYCPTLGSLGMTLTTCGSFDDQSPLRLVCAQRLPGGCRLSAYPEVLILMVGQA